MSANQKNSKTATIKPVASHESHQKSSYAEAVRIASVPLPNKRICIALTYIHGIGVTTALQICAALKINENKRPQALTSDEISAIATHIRQTLVVEGDLRKRVSMDIKNKINLGTYQGRRHKAGLPVRGQRTRTNAKTRKGRSAPIANKKKITK